MFSHGRKKIANSSALQSSTKASRSIYLLPSDFSRWNKKMIAKKDQASNAQIKPENL
jgi:hypothetical protein